jgi:hypothetical protein
MQSGGGHRPRAGSLGLGWLGSWRRPRRELGKPLESPGHEQRPRRELGDLPPPADGVGAATNGGDL